MIGNVVVWAIGFSAVLIQGGGVPFIVAYMFLPWPVALAVGLVSGAWYFWFVSRKVDDNIQAKGRLAAERARRQSVE